MSDNSINAIIGGIQCQATRLPYATPPYTQLIVPPGNTIKLPLTEIEVTTFYRVKPGDPGYANLIAVAKDKAGQDAAILGVSYTIKVDETGKIKQATQAGQAEQLSIVSSRQLTDDAEEFYNNDSTSAKTNVNIGTNSEVTTLGLISTAYPNLLHNYGSYTYSLTLSAMTPKTYNEMIENPTVGFAPENIMISSGGRFNDTAQMDPRFKDTSFFFDKLEFQTVIGMTTVNRNSNALTSEFTIIEPYGMTFLNRLIDMSSDINADNKGNYIQLPYMLQIDFFGFDDNGLPQQIPNISKYIPIQIVGIKFKIGTKGTEYNVSAVPYSHSAFSESSGTTPIKLEVAASTIQEFFLSNAHNSVVASSNDVVKATGTVRIPPSVADKAREKVDREESSKIVATDRESQDKKKKLNEEADALSKTKYVSYNTSESLNVRSYAGALNAWQQRLLLDGHIGVIDEYAFVIDSDIASATLPSIDDINKQKKQMSTGDNTVQDTTKTGIAQQENPISLYTINQGTSVIDVIGTAIKNSSFITKQYLKNKKTINKVEMQKFLDEPLVWFNIVPEITIREFDTKNNNNRYGKKITYYITKKLIPQTKNSDFPMGGPEYICKDYQYIFTGKNQDILNFDLNFDTQFYIVNPSNAINAEATSQSLDKKATETTDTAEENKALNSSDIEQLLDNRSRGINELKPKKVQVAKISQIGNAQGEDAERIQQLEKNILATPAGDQVQVTLKIIGDPDFIKQDDCFYGAHGKIKNNTDKRKTPNGSLITDAADLYVHLAFKTPVDYNENGLASPTDSKNKYSTSLFSGVYRIITVKNVFSNGKFEQELNLIRYSMQPSDLGILDTASVGSTAERETTIQATENSVGTRTEQSTTVLAGAANPTTASLTSPPIPTTADVVTASGDNAISATTKGVTGQGVTILSPATKNTELGTTKTTTYSILMIGNQPVVEGTELTNTQMNIINNSSPNTYPDYVMKQYQKQLSTEPWTVLNKQ